MNLRGFCVKSKTRSVFGLQGLCDELACWVQPETSSVKYIFLDNRWLLIIWRNVSVQHKTALCSSVASCVRCERTVQQNDTLAQPGSPITTCVPHAAHSQPNPTRQHCWFQCSIQVVLWVCDRNHKIQGALWQAARVTHNRWVSGGATQSVSDLNASWPRQSCDHYWCICQ